MTDDDKKPLSLVKEFNSAHWAQQYGYQKVDDTTVLERKKIPVVVYSNSEAEPWAVWISVYDFKSCQVLTYIQQTYDSGARTPTMAVRNFSEIEGKQAIIDAHCALIKLGGSPAPLDESLTGRLNKQTTVPRLS